MKWLLLFLIGMFVFPATAALLLNVACLMFIGFCIMVAGLYYMVRG